MKNVLIIASLYGSKRVLSLAKYLPEFGWQPTIITPPITWQPTIITPPITWQPTIITPLSRKIPLLPFEVVVTDYKDISDPLRKLLKVDTLEDAKLRVKKLVGAQSQYSWVDRLFKISGMFLNYPDSHRGWRRYAVSAGDKILLKRNTDAILSICPITSHIVASKLKAMHNIFWLADFPDLWSQNFNHSYGTLRRIIDRRLEKSTMSNVDTIVASSASCAERLGLLHSYKPTYSIPLGYDPEDYDAVPVPLTPKFTITYTGLIYAGKQNPSKLLTALSELFTTGQIDRKDCDIRFYGRELPWLAKELSDLHLSDIVQQCKAVPHNIIVDIQKKSQILLLLDWDVSNEFGAYAAKVFEYLGARRPILAVGGVPGNAVSKLLKETNSGIHAPTVTEVREALLHYYKEYKLSGKVAYLGEETEIQKHNQRIMAGRFARLLSGGGGGC